MRHAADKVVTLCQACHPLHLLIGGVAAANAYVIGNGSVEEQHVLKDDGIAFQQLFRVNGGDVAAAEQNLSAVNVPEACGQSRGGALASARRSHKGGDLSLTCGEGDVVQNLFAVFVSEADVAEFDVVIAYGQALASCLHGHGFYLFHAVDAHVEEGQDNKIVVHILYGIVNHGCHDEEGQVNKYRHFAPLQHPGSGENDRRQAQFQQHGREVDKDGGCQFVLLQLPFVTPQPFVEAAAKVLFAVVRLDFLHAFQPFLHLLGYATLHTIEVFEGTVEASSGQKQHAAAERYNPEEGEGQPPIVAEEAYGNGEHAQNGGEHLRYGVRECLLKLRAVFHNG